MRSGPSAGIMLVQVLAEQCRRLGIDVEASSAHIAALSEPRGAARKKAAWNLDISSIHRRVKEDLRSTQRARAAAASDPPPYTGDSTLPAGWEVLRSSTTLTHVIFECVLWTASFYMCSAQVNSCLWRLQARRDEATGREFYIDHNSRRTTWARPTAVHAPDPGKGGGSASGGSSTPAGVSPDSSSTDLASAAETPGGASAGADGKDTAVDDVQDHRFGLFGLTVDQVCANLSLSCHCCPISGSKNLPSRSLVKMQLYPMLRQCKNASRTPSCVSAVSCC
jgi:hypothetical protein